MAEILPLDPVVLAEAELLRTFEALMRAFGVAQAVGLEPAPILVAALERSLAEQGETLPPMLRMLF